MNALEIRDLSKNYGNFNLSHLNLTLPGGCIMGLVGENGAGKSTTIKLILNMIHRDGGSISILGRDNVTEMQSLKEDIGVVLDEVGLPECLNRRQVGNIMALTFKNWDSDYFEALCVKLGVPDQKKFGEYSKGMKMKLSLAAAFAARPRLLILDEATSGLDPVVRDEILDEFLAFIQDEEHAILLSSHITSDLEKVADYVTYLHRGRVAVSGAKDELLDTYGKLVCGRSELERVDPALLVGVRSGQFGCEALVKNRRAFARFHPELAVEPVSLEDIMVFTVKGDAR